MEEPLTDTSIEPHRLFSRPILAVLRDKLGNLRLRRHLQLVALVGRNIATDSQVLDPIIDAQSRVLTNPYGGLAFDFDVTVATFQNLVVGQTGLHHSIPLTGTAGTATATLPTAVVVTTNRLYEVLEVLTWAVCDATIIGRTMTVTVDAGLPKGHALLDFSLSGPALTQSQSGTIFMPHSPGQIQLNDNGTITQSNTNPLPFMLHHGPANTPALSSTITTGQAGDLHGIAAVVRRVA